ncbi:MAG TPA: tRNA (N6-threonylcarbamoyladenosine(37)-N6)-methyltransferase TrmO [Myxococcaceae bacterium]|nr:tRNA (N6-threonylcarbamoyladenosine(37)-N6)-methyltransferase TrmO [Myxococcaceae bacterium]
MTTTELLLRPVGVVRSELRDREVAPMQGDEGAPDAWIELRPEVVRAAASLAPGDELLVLTWFHEADRSVVEVHPRSDPSRSLTGVFSTRSPDRPNPVGLHRVRVLAVEKQRIRVGPLEAIDGTPVIDLKPVLRTDGR